MSNTNQPVLRNTRSSYVPPNNPYPLAVRKLVGKNVSEGKWTAAHAASKYGCSVSVVSNWKKTYVNGGPWYEKSSRPRHISPHYSQEVLENITKKSKSGNAVSKPAFKKMMQSAAQKTRKEENNNPVILPDRYINEYMKENNIHVANAEVTDNAHSIALHDPRHAASHAAMMQYLHNMVPDGLFFNMDKTSFEIKQSDHELAPAVYIGQRPQSLHCDDPYTTSTPGNCAVHVFLAANDSGKLADVVYLVRDDRMGADELDVYEVPVLDPFASANSTAFLLFIGTSSTNKDVALEWLLRTIVIPFICTIRARNRKDCSTPVSLSVDGDPRQLQVIATSCIRSAFLLANIIATKSPASCTPIFQPLDVGKVFLSAKTSFKSLLEKGFTPEKAAQMALLEVFQMHRRAHPAAKTKKKQIASVAMGPYFTSVMKCLHMVAEALRKTVSVATVKNSFKSAGVSPFDVSTIRDKCQFEWSDEQKAQFDSSVPVLAAVIARNFELKENDFENAHIPVNNENKDALPVHRRRALVLHSPHSIQDLDAQATKKRKT